MALPRDFASMFRGGNAALRPQPMAPTMGSQIGSMFGGARRVSPQMPVIRGLGAGGRSIGQIGGYWQNPGANTLAGMMGGASRPGGFWGTGR